MNNRHAWMVRGRHTIGDRLWPGYATSIHTVGAGTVSCADASAQALVVTVHASGVSNIEMESAELAAFCNHAGIPALMIAVVIINRLDGDQVRVILGMVQCRQAYAYCPVLHCVAVDD